MYGDLRLLPPSSVLSRSCAAVGSSTEDAYRSATLRYRPRASPPCSIPRDFRFASPPIRKHVMEAAAESWEPFAARFDTPPLDFRVVVEPQGELTQEPRFRKQGDVLSFVSDAYNFATGDCQNLSAVFHLSEATAADHASLRWFYLEALAYMLLTQRYVVSLHAGCVARGGAGILICGKSAAGKSTLSFAAARAGFTFVADDCTWLLLDSGDRLGDRQAAPGPLPPGCRAALSRTARPPREFAP